ncbi:MAG: hypothetical protein WC229_02170 [Candidatus Paceibacterota bacterium]|jgi:hypothetical protein
MGNVVDNLKERFENRKVKAIVGNLDFFRLLQECLNAKESTDEEKHLKKIAYENLKKTCLTLDPKDVRVLLAYIQVPRSHPISNILKEAVSRSDLTYEEWCWAVSQTFFTDGPKK